jgi:1-acyl-sn-glycerol-3-phosphate acyltransferase
MLLPTLLYPVVRFALWLFFKRIHITGLDNVPRDRPLLLLANHPNMMLDALLLAAYTPGRIPFFVGKSTLFGSRWTAFILARLGVIAAERPQDIPTEPGSQRLGTNTNLLLQTSTLLERGQALALFPEGRCHSGQRLLPLKSGAARFALRLEDRTDGCSGLHIIPVALNYEYKSEAYKDDGQQEDEKNYTENKRLINTNGFRTRVEIHFGPPLSAQPYLHSYHANRHQGISALTALFYRRLQTMTEIQAMPWAQKKTGARLWITAVLGAPLAALGWLAGLPTKVVPHLTAGQPPECRPSYTFAAGGLVLTGTCLLVSILGGFLLAAPMAGAGALLLGAYAFFLFYREDIIAECSPQTSQRSVPTGPSDPSHQQHDTFPSGINANPAKE